MTGHFEDNFSDPMGPANPFDLLTGRQSVEDVVADMSKVRTEMSPAELGVMAGRGVLDQLRTAKADTTLRPWKHPSLALTSFYTLVGVGVPALSLISGLLIDFAIFGGTSTSLMAVSKWFIALSLGSLIFAVGLGTENRHRTLLLVLSLGACLGASIIEADNPAFRDHFANLIPSMKQAERDAQSKQALVNGQVIALRKQIETEEDRLETGGFGGKPILGDSSRDNDEAGHELEKAIKKDISDLGTIEGQLKAADYNVQQATTTNTAQDFGRLIGGLYIFAWLAASQIVVGTVIRIGPDLLKKQRERASRYNVKALFVRQMESTNPVRVRSLARAAVSDLLIRFDRILTLAAGEDAQRQKALQALFEAEPLQQMTEIGVELVIQTLPSFTEVSR